MSQERYLVLVIIIPMYVCTYIYYVLHWRQVLTGGSPCRACSAREKLWVDGRVNNSDEKFTSVGFLF